MFIYCDGTDPLNNNPFLGKLNMDQKRKMEKNNIDNNHKKSKNNTNGEKYKKRPLDIINDNNDNKKRKNNFGNNLDNNDNNDKNNKNNNRKNNKNPKNKKNSDKNNEDDQSILPFLLLLDKIINDIDGEKNSSPPVSPYICPGKFCDHDPESKNVPIIPLKLTNLSDKYKIILKDLIDLGASFHCKCQQYFNSISLERLAKMYDSLIKLDKMVGMKIIKESFAEQIVYFLLDIEPSPAEMLHTVLEGPPGVGKSYVIDILAEIYLKMGYLTKNIVKKVKINDLKGKYIGHTAPLTQKAIDEAMGGVLVIDEAYSLASSENLDSFSKELIDTLNRNLTENAGKFICIIAGYGDQIEQCLFAHNVGLKSRFRFRFVIDAYSPEELLEIFELKIKKDNWNLHENIQKNDLTKFFKEKYKTFKYFGRDMETLLFHTKVVHSNRVFFESAENKYKITLEDIKIGYQRFLLHSNIKKDTNKIPSIIEHMYL